MVCNRKVPKEEKLRQIRKKKKRKRGGGRPRKIKRRTGPDSGPEKKDIKNGRKKTITKKEGRPGLR